MLVKSMYTNVRSCMCVDDGYHEEFSVVVGVHQGSVLSPLLFIVVLEALSLQLSMDYLLELLFCQVNVREHKVKVWNLKSATSSQDDVSYDCLLERLVIKDIEAVLFSSRIRWLSHVDHCSVWMEPELESIIS
jgi:hypothetical protein